MASQFTTLTSSDIQRFERDGYVVVRQAFSPADGLRFMRIKQQVLSHEGRKLQSRLHRQDS